MGYTLGTKGGTLGTDTDGAPALARTSRTEGERSRLSCRGSRSGSGASRSGSDESRSDPRALGTDGRGPPYGWGGASVRIGWGLRTDGKRVLFCS